MGKTPKKAAPGGDERNLYNRRLKATTAPSNPSESSLHKRQRESEILNRPKLSTLKRKVSPNQKKNIENKLRTPTKFGPKRQVGRPPGSVKEKTSAVPDKGEPSTSANMQPESEETEVKLNPVVQTEDTGKNIVNDTQESDKDIDKHIDHTFIEPVSTSKSEEAQDLPSKDTVDEKEEIVCQEKASCSEKNKDLEEHEENIILHFEAEDSSVKLQEERENEKNSEEESSEACPSTEEITKDKVNEKDESLQNESETNTENNSADDLPFAGSGSEVSKASQSSTQSDVPKEKEKREDSISKDISFVSYDPSIMLKDVQIKLNDCLKENSKLLNASNITDTSNVTDISNVAHTSTPSQPSKSVSFGKTLRSISGRRSLNRMRHVTLREHRYSPNDSMFVNTSSISLPADDTEDFKILRYTTGLSDTLTATNGSPTEKKRKHDTEDWNSTKKPKMETENSLLNTSISLLKGLRRPIQVSTPVSELKFGTGKLELDEERKSASEGNKKWCVVM